MREEYVIQAHSPSKNQTIREFNLEMGNPSITNKVQALQIATSFADRLNKQKHLQATDWQPKVEWQQLGIETIPGFLSSK